MRSYEEGEEMALKLALKWMREGAKAAKDGAPRESIPYPWKTYAGINWLMGYDNIRLAKGQDDGAYDEAHR